MKKPFRVAYAVLAAGLIAAPILRAQMPSWTDRGTCYEIFIRSFSDADGNGIGDLPGLMSKLRYLNNLGVRCVWLMPVAQSPSYHGYDVSDYYHVNRDYGTETDFR